MLVKVINKQREMKISLLQVRRMVKHLLQAMRISCDEVTIHFVDKKMICQLHQEYFDDPSPTDCISFPMDEAGAPFYCILGEIFVCPVVAMEYSVTRDRDPYEELSLYIVHGLLHLLGYDDIDERDRKKMRRAERDQMHLLKERELLLTLPLKS